MVRLLQWEKDGKRPVGEVVSVLDAENTNDAAMKEILLENGFPLASFLMMLWKWQQEYPIQFQRNKKRKDVRDILTFTIDPVDAKDFDDAISFPQIKEWQL